MRVVALVAALSTCIAASSSCAAPSTNATNTTLDLASECGSWEIEPTLALERPSWCASLCGCSCTVPIVGVGVGVGVGGVVYAAWRWVYWDGPSEPAESGAQITDDDARDAAGTLVQLGGDGDGGQMDGTGHFEAAAALLEIRGSRGADVSSFSLDSASQMAEERRGLGQGPVEAHVAVGRSVISGTATTVGNLARALEPQMARLGFRESGFFLTLRDGTVLPEGTPLSELNHLGLLQARLGQAPYFPPPEGDPAVPEAHPAAPEARPPPAPPQNNNAPSTKRPKKAPKAKRAAKTPTGTLAKPTSNAGDGGTSRSGRVRTKSQKARESTEEPEATHGTTHGTKRKRRTVERKVKKRFLLWFVDEVQRASVPADFDPADDEALNWWYDKSQSSWYVRPSARHSAFEGSSRQRAEAKIPKVGDPGYEGSSRQRGTKKYNSRTCSKSGTELLAGLCPCGARSCGSLLELKLSASMLGRKMSAVPSSFSAPSLSGFVANVVHQMLDAALPHGLPTRAFAKYDIDHIMPRTEFPGLKEDVAEAYRTNTISPLIRAAAHVSNLQLLFSRLNQHVKKAKFPAAALAELVEYRKLFFEDDAELAKAVMDLTKLTARSISDILESLKHRACQPGAWFLGCGPRPSADEIKKLVEKHPV